MPTSSSSPSSRSTSRKRISLASFTSLSTSSSSSSLRRLSVSSNHDQPPSTPSTVPFAEPPFMPMFKSSTSHSPSSSVTIREGAGGGKKEPAQISTSVPGTASQSSSASSPSPSTPTQGTSRHSKRFFRRLHKRGNGRGELDFGCVGEWNEGPSDLSSSYYDSHKSNRNSSSSLEFSSPSHSRGHSSSSTLSFSTAASSLPPSPTFACDAPLAPHPSRVPLSPRAASKKRQTEEAAAVDALNDYFVKVRLSQIEEDGPVHHSVSIGDSSYSAPPPSSTFTPYASSRGQGLAIFGSSKKVHDRSVSADLEIEFIETGHTTFTPLSADSPSYSSAILLPEDAFFTSTAGEGMCYDIDTAEDSLSNSTCTSVRTPIPEMEMGQALDELSTFFSSPPNSSPVVSQSSSFFSAAPSSPHLYSRSRRPDSFQAARQARQSSQAVRYDWI
ncbi:hypothetical protein JCM11491_003620 [Sporobolomyces phaffii]